MPADEEIYYTDADGNCENCGGEGEIMQLDGSVHACYPCRLQAARQDGSDPSPDTPDTQHEDSCAVATKRGALMAAEDKLRELAGSAVEARLAYHAGLSDRTHERWRSALTLFEDGCDAEDVLAILNALDEARVSCNAAIARAEKAERQRDEARAERDELDGALADVIDYSANEDPDLIDVVELAKSLRNRAWGMPR